MTDYISSDLVMLVVIASIVVIIVASTLFSRWKVIFLFYYIMAVICLGLVRTARNVKDYANYLDSYTNVMLGNYHNFEPIYFYTTVAFNYVNLDFAAFAILFLIVDLLIKLRVFYSFAKIYNFSMAGLFLLYSSYLLFLHELVQIRISMALALAMYGILVWLCDKKGRALLLMGVSVLFHSSTLLLCVVFLSLLYIRKQHKLFFLFLPVIGISLGAFINFQNIQLVSSYFSHIEILARLNFYLGDLQGGRVWSTKHFWALAIHFTYWLGVKNQIKSDEALPGRMAAVGLALFYSMGSLPAFAYRAYELFEIFMLMQMLLIFNRNKLIGFGFISGYIILSIRAVFFIEQPLISIYPIY